MGKTSPIRSRHADLLICCRVGRNKLKAIALDILRACKRERERARTTKEKRASNGYMLMWMEITECEDLRIAHRIDLLSLVIFFSSFVCPSFENVTQHEWFIEMRFLFAVFQLTHSFIVFGDKTTNDIVHNSQFVLVTFFPSCERQRQPQRQQRNKWTRSSVVYVTRRWTMVKNWFSTHLR